MPWMKIAISKTMTAADAGKMGNRLFTLVRLQLPDDSQTWLSVFYCSKSVDCSME